MQDKTSMDDLLNDIGEVARKQVFILQKIKQATGSSASQKHLAEDIAIAINSLAFTQAEICGLIAGKEPT